MQYSFPNIKVVKDKDRGMAPNKETRDMTMKYTICNPIKEKKKHKAHYWNN